MNKKIEKKITNFQNKIRQEISSANGLSRYLILDYCDDTENIRNVKDAALLFGKLLEIRIKPDEIMLASPIAKYNTDEPIDKDRNAFVYPLPDGSWIFAYPEDDIIGFWDRRLFEVSHSVNILNYRHARIAAFRYLLIILAIFIFWLVIVALQS